VGADQSSGSSASLDCQNIYFLLNSLDTIIYAISGPNLQFITSNIGYNQGETFKPWPNGPPDNHASTYLSTYWNDMINIPSIKVILRK
jgi:hypothetical protein